MRTLMVKEKIRVRFRYLWGDGWKAWQETTDSFEVACEKAKAEVRTHYDTAWQVAKYYYDTNDHCIAWDPGEVFSCMNVEREEEES